MTSGIFKRMCWGVSWEIHGRTGHRKLFYELLSLDSPVGPKHGDAGGQDPHRPQQMDHRPELGAPSHVSDTKLRHVSWG